MKSVCWNKDFYEKYKDVFDVEVFAKLTRTFTETGTRGYNYTSSTFRSSNTETVRLNLSGGYTEESGHITIHGSVVRYQEDCIFMTVPDEIPELFPDLRPWIDYSISYTTYSSWI